MRATYTPRSYYFFDPFGEPRKPKDPYEVLTLHREWDNTCVVRLQGFDNRVFWKEIKLNKWYLFKSPRERILDAQTKAARKAEQLKWRDMQAKHEFDISVRSS